MSKPLLTTRVRLATALSVASCVAIGGWNRTTDAAAWRHTGCRLTATLEGGDRLLVLTGRTRGVADLLVLDAETGLAAATLARGVSENMTSWRLVRPLGDDRYAYATVPPGKFVPSNQLRIFEGGRSRVVAERTVSGNEYQTLAPETADLSLLDVTEPETFVTRVFCDGRTLTGVWLSWVYLSESPKSAVMTVARFDARTLRRTSLRQSYVADLSADLYDGIPDVPPERPTTVRVGDVRAAASEFGLPPPAGLRWSSVHRGGALLARDGQTLAAGWSAGTEVDSVFGIAYGRHRRDVVRVWTQSAGQPALAADLSRTTRSAFGLTAGADRRDAALVLAGGGRTLVVARSGGDGHELAGYAVPAVSSVEKP